MDERKEAEIELAKAEIKAAFRAVALEAGFRLKGFHALRRRDGAQQRLSLARVSGDRYKIDMMVRLDRPGDKGEEVLSEWDIGTMTDYFVKGAEERALHRAVLDLRRPPLEAERGPEIQRFVRLVLPWFDAISSREAIERTTRDNEYRIQMHGITSPKFYDDFGIPRPPRQI